MSRIVSINGQLCYLAACKQEKGEFHIIVSFNMPREAKEDYAQSWQIEIYSKAMKASGFDMGKTRHTDLGRIEEPVLLVMMAFVWCYKVRIYLNNIRPIRSKSTVRKARTLFKSGLNYISNCLLNAPKIMEINIVQCLSYT